MLISQAAESSRALQGLLQSPPPDSGLSLDPGHLLLLVSSCLDALLLSHPRENSSPSWEAEFQQVGRNSFHTCGAKQGKVEGGVTLRTTTKR